MKAIRENDSGAFGDMILSPGDADEVFDKLPADEREKGKDELAKMKRLHDERTNMLATLRDHARTLGVSLGGLEYEEMVRGKVEKK